ncbi:MAG: sialidase family protein [Candidatus Micrarchaeia archaeon]
MTVRANDTGGPVAENTLKVLCSNSSYIFGIDGTAAKLYRSVDGDTWADLGTLDPVVTTQTAGAASCNLFCLDNDRLLRTYYVAADGHYHFCYSDDNGATWTVSTGANLKGNFAAWGVAKNSNTGTWMAVTYSSATTSTMQRSTDNGATWSQLYSTLDGTDTSLLISGSDYVSANHYHAIGCLSDSNTWIVNTGDIAVDHNDYVWDYISTDDGVTWSRIATQTTGRGNGWNYQIVQFLDTGHATRILCASDGFDGVFQYDLATGRKYPCNINWLPKSSTHNCFNVVKVNGIYYASSWDSVTSGRTAVISISTDLTNWTTYARFNDGTVIGNYIYAGFRGGYLHFAASTATSSLPFGGVTNWKHVLLKPATITSTKGILVEPACTNIFTSAQASDGNTATGFTDAGVGYGTIASVTDTSLYGPNSVRIQEGVGGSATPNRIITLRGNASTLQTGDANYYVSSAYAKGRGGGMAMKLNRGAYMRFVAAYTEQSSTDYDYISLNDERWIRIWTKPVSASTANSVRASYFVIGQFPETNLADAIYYNQIWVDCTQIQALPPTSWQIAGTARVAETWSVPITVGADWSFKFTMIPQFRSLMVDNLATDLYVCTLKLDATHYAEVYWDCSEKKWTFSLLNITGSPVVTATAATGFEPANPLIFVVRRLSDELYLSVHDGKSWTHIAASTDTEVLTGTITWQVGDNVGANLMPELITDIWYAKNTALSETQVEALPSSLFRAGFWLGSYDWLK